MKRLFVIFTILGTLLVAGCSEETAEKTVDSTTKELTKQVKELKEENSKLKTENAKLIKKIELMQKKD